MSKQTTRSTKKSLGLVSDRDIDLWNSDVKRKMNNSQKSGMKVHNKNIGNSQINNEQDFSIIFDTSLNRLRERTRSQRSNSSTLSNRMKYLQVDLRRKKQMAQIAKTKYQKMIEVRQKSFVEKKELKRQRQNLSKKHLMSVTLQASRIRVERKNSTITTQIWKDKNQEAANYVKDRRFVNQKFIAERQQIEVEKKRTMVEREHQLSEVSREKLLKLSSQKIVKGKQHHNQKMIQQYAKGEIQRRKNVNLLGLFKEKVRKIGQQSSKYKNQLQQYEQMLGWKYNTSRKSHSKNEFYITTS